MRRGFTIIESFFMLVAIFMVTWIGVAVLKKNGTWPFKPETIEVKKGRSSLIQPVTTRVDSEKTSAGNPPSELRVQKGASLVKPAAEAPK